MLKLQENVAATVAAENERTNQLKEKRGWNRQYNLHNYARQFSITNTDPCTKTDDYISK